MNDPANGRKNTRDWPWALAGFALGGLNVAGFWLAVSYALRNGLSGPSPWYDWPVCALLTVGPGIAWIAAAAWRASRPGRPWPRRLAGAVLQVSAMGAGFAAAWLLAMGAA